MSMSIVTLCATLPDSKVPRMVDVYRHFVCYVTSQVRFPSGVFLPLLYVLRYLTVRSPEWWMSIVTLCVTLPDSKVPRVVDVYDVYRHFVCYVT